MVLHYTYKFIPYIFLFFEVYFKSKYTCVMCRCIISRK